MSLKQGEDDEGIPPTESEEAPAVTAKAASAPRRKKSRDMPRRPLSAYNLFFRDERARILAMINKEDGERDADYLANAASVTKEGGGSKSNASIRFKAIAMTIAQRWKALDVVGRTEYERLAAGEMDRYKVRKSDYLQNQVRKSRLAASLQAEDAAAQAAAASAAAGAEGITSSPRRGGSNFRASEGVNLSSGVSNPFGGGLGGVGGMSANLQQPGFHGGTSALSMLLGQSLLPPTSIQQQSLPSWMTASSPGSFMVPPSQAAGLSGAELRMLLAQQQLQEQQVRMELDQSQQRQRAFLIQRELMIRQQQQQQQGQDQQGMSSDVANSLRELLAQRQGPGEGLSIQQQQQQQQQQPPSAEESQLLRMLLERQQQGSHFPPYSRN